MSRAKAILFYGALFLTGTAVAGLMGGAVSIALVTKFANRPAMVENFERVTIHSEVLGESVDLRVHLPAVYGSDPTLRYPVLWTLDGSSHGTHMMQTVEDLQSVDRGEGMIVVAVPGSSAGRADDFIPPGASYGQNAGRADRFLEFIRNEALPAIDAAYQTDSTRVLAGNSLGGLFVTYALIQDPELFDGWLAFSPSWWAGDEAMVRELQGFLDSNPDVETFLYTSLGALEGGRMRGAFDAVSSVLRESAPASIEWRSDITAGADHGNNAVLSTAVAVNSFWR